MSYKLEWIASPNFTPGNQTAALYGRPRSLDMGAGHWWNWPRSGASHDGVVSMFRNAARQVASHAVASAGRVTEMVRPEDTAWCTSSANPYTYSIEIDPRIMFKWGYDGASAAEKQLGEQIFETVAEYIADKGYHNLVWKPHNQFVAGTECNPIVYNELMQRARQIYAAKHEAPKPPTPPAAANLEWREFSEGVRKFQTNKAAKLWNFNQTAWGGFGNGVKDFAKGDLIDIKGYVINHTLNGATYLLTPYSYDNRVTNGFNQADLTLFVPAPPPAPEPPVAPEWQRNIEDIEPVKLMVLVAQTPIVHLENLGNIKLLGQGTWVDFTKKTTVAGVVYLISSYSATNGMPNGIRQTDVGVPDLPPNNEKPSWLTNWRDIENVVMYARVDAALVNLMDGSIVKRIPRGTPIRISSATEWLERKWLITEYSTDRKEPRGILLDDLDMKPIIPDAPTIPTKPEEPTTGGGSNNGGDNQGGEPMNNTVISVIRTVVPSIVGAVLAFLAGQDIAVTPEFAAQLTGVLTVLFTGAYYLIGRALEKINPKFGLLLGYAKQPEYKQ